jgi:hypothetical protein
VTAFVSVAVVKDVLGYTANDKDAAIGSNITAASEFLQRATGRQFARVLGQSRTFTSHGQAVVTIPDYAAGSNAALTLQSTSLVSGESYWLVPDRMAQLYGQNVYTSVQLRTFGGFDYRSNPEWFDRNLDSPLWRAGSYSSLPGDLVITGNWGWEPLPNDLLDATKVLAAWKTKRKDAVLTDVTVTPEGTNRLYSLMPPEVQDFIESWRLAPMVTAV